VATSFTLSRWQPLSRETTIVSGKALRLNGGQRKYSYFLVWITRLPAGLEYAAVNEIKLYR